MSIFKRLFGDRDDTNNSSVRIFKPQHATIKAMGSNLQKRFSRGVQYNMKILIRGDRNVGKSALLNRLKGQDFVDQYIPTEEIEVACIHWTYKSTEDVVKVEVWDVVDKGRKKIVTGLKLENNGATEEVPPSLCLDAEFLDVYKGAHGVIVMLDMTKSWTLNYVERELSKLREDLPVLVLANHRDMGHHRTVSEDQVRTLIEALPGYERGIVKYWECSMKNGYGLVYIHRFFNIPFLTLQRDTLLRQLETNDSELKATMDDLEEFEESPEGAYETFQQSLKGVRASLANQKPSSLALHSSPTSQINSPCSPSIHPALAKGSVTPTTDHGSRPPIHPPQARPIPGMDKLGLYPLPVPTDGAVVVDPLVTDPTLATVTPPHKKQIYDFVPDEQTPELSSFLDDPTSSRSPDSRLNSRSSSSSSSSDHNDRHSSINGPSPHHSSHKSKRSNPMVAVFRDDIDSDDNDVCPSSAATQSIAIHNHSEPTSSDEQTEPYSLPIALSSKKSSNESSSVAVNATVVLLQRSISDVSSSNTVTVEEPTVNPYSQIAFNATELDILEQISSKKEVDNDEITVISSSSHRTKKKSKKHHKQSEAKEPGTTKRKKKSGRKSDDDTESTSVTRHSKRHHTKPVINDIPVQVVKCESTDSLEKFLNE